MTAIQQAKQLSLRTYPDYIQNPAQDTPTNYLRIAKILSCAELAASTHGVVPLTDFFKRYWKQYIVLSVGMAILGLVVFRDWWDVLFMLIFPPAILFLFYMVLVSQRNRLYLANKDNFDKLEEDSIMLPTTIGLFEGLEDMLETLQTVGYRPLLPVNGSGKILDHALYRWELVNDFDVMDDAKQAELLHIVQDYAELHGAYVDTRRRIAGSKTNAETLAKKLDTRIQNFNQWLVRDFESRQNLPQNYQESTALERPKSP